MKSRCIDYNVDMNVAACYAYSTYFMNYSPHLNKLPTAKNQHIVRW